MREITTGIVAGVVKLGVDPNKLYAPDVKPKDSETNNAGTNTLKYTPPSKALTAFPDAKRVPNKGRTRWKAKEGGILKLHLQRADDECCNKQGGDIRQCRSWQDDKILDN